MNTSVLKAPADFAPLANNKLSGPRVVDLLTMPDGTAVNQGIDIIRINQDDVLLIPFTTESVAVDTHYCHEPDINGYVVCNGDDCILCRLGRKKDTKLLLPMYAPTEQRVGVLPMSRSHRPGALFPQIQNVLKTSTPTMAIVRRINMRYEVFSRNLPDGVDEGAVLIRKFLNDQESGLIDLTLVFQRISNQHLAMCAEISRAMLLRGVSLDADRRA